MRDPRLREKFLRGNAVDGQSENKENNPDSETQPSNPQIDKEINELEKIRNSGTAQLILEDLKKKQKLDPLKLDPRSSSRSRSAAVEPPQRTRFESPVFACEFLFVWSIVAIVLRDCYLMVSVPVWQSPRTLGRTYSRVLHD